MNQIQTTQSVENKFKGFLECAEHGEISYDHVYTAGVKMGIPEVEVARLVGLSSGRRNRVSVGDSEKDGGLNTLTITGQD